MITLKTIVNVKRISGESIYNFMLNCTDEEYQKWWPGTHLAFHTIRRYPNDFGNLVYFDEYVGSRRLKFKGVVIKNIPGKKIVWQMKKVMKLPVWLMLKFEDNNEGVKITHSIIAGFDGIGKILDFILKFYFSREFEKQLDEHAHVEFVKLEKILI